MGYYHPIGKSAYISSGAWEKKLAKVDQNSEKGIQKLWFLLLALSLSLSKLDGHKKVNLILTFSTSYGPHAP